MNYTPQQRISPNRQAQSSMSVNAFSRGALKSGEFPRWARYGNPSPNLLENPQQSKDWTSTDCTRYRPHNHFARATVPAWIPDPGRTCPIFRLLGVFEKVR